MAFFSGFWGNWGLRARGKFNLHFFFYLNISCSPFFTYNMSHTRKPQLPQGKLSGALGSRVGSPRPIGQIVRTAASALIIGIPHRGFSRTGRG